MTDIHTWDGTDANNTSSPPAGAPEGHAPSKVNDIFRAVMGASKRRYLDTNGSLTTGGSSNAYTLTPNDTYSSYADGMTFIAEANHTNTGASTLNVSSLGAKSIVLPDATALIGNEIVSGGRYVVSYDGTNFQLMNPSSKLRRAIYKTANQTMGGGMLNDTHLMTTVAANSVYLVELVLYLTIADTVNTPTTVWDFSAPSGTTAYGAEIGNNQAVVEMVASDYTMSTTVASAMESLHVVVETAGTAGTLQLRHQGGTLAFGYNTLKKGSAMFVTKLG